MLWGWNGRVGAIGGVRDSTPGPPAGTRHFRTIGTDCILTHSGIEATAEADASLLREGVTATTGLDGFVNNHFDPETTLDAALQGTQTRETGLGRLVQHDDFTISASFDGQLVQSFTETAVIDGWLQGTTAVQAEISAVLAEPPPGTQHRAIFLHYKLLHTFTATAEIGAIVNGPKALTAGLGAVLFNDGITRSTILGGTLKNTLTRTTGVHGVIQHPWALTTLVDHRISKVFTATAGIGATVKNNLTVAASIDAELEATPVGGDNALDFNVLDNSFYLGTVV